MKKTARLAVFCAVLTLLCVGLLSGCAEYMEYRRAFHQMEQQAKTMALDYVAETYGGQAGVVGVEVGTTQAGFSSYVDTDALVTVSLDGEEFQVYVETGVPQFCADNRDGLALAEALDEYFRALYGLPAALEHSVRVYFGDEFFASYPTHLAHDFNFLPFEYHGQPLEEVLPLLDQIDLLYNYADDSVSLESIDFRAEDWGGSVERLRVSLYAFRVYDPDGKVPLGIELLDGHPVLMAEGMQFSRRSGGYGSLSDIREQVPYFAVREMLMLRGGEASRISYAIARMGDFWIITRDGLSVQECFELRDLSPDWSGWDKMGVWAWGDYTREEIESGELLSNMKKVLPPFLDAQFYQTGQMLCLKDGALEEIRAWEGFVPYNACSVPVWVVVRPSLVYGVAEQMGVGLLHSSDGETEVAVQLFTGYLDQKERWFNALDALKFNYPHPQVLEGIALVRVET